MSGRKDWAPPGSEYIQARRDTIVLYACLHANGKPVVCMPAGGKITYPSADAADRCARILEGLGGGIMLSYSCSLTSPTMHSHLATRKHASWLPSHDPEVTDDD